MKKLAFLFVLSILFTACSDLAKEKQLKSIAVQQNKLSQLDLKLSANKIDTVAGLRWACNAVEIRIKNNLYQDTVDNVLGKKMDDYKRMRRSFGPISKAYSQLKGAVKEENLALNNLRFDIENGSGQRDKYDNFIAFEKDKIDQMNILYEDYAARKKDAMFTFNRLHASLDSFSRQLLLDHKK